MTASTRPGRRARWCSATHGRWATSTAPTVVSEQLLARIGFSTHALDRFTERAGLAPTTYRQVEQIIRDLLRQEGLATHERPHWARCQNTAAQYLQAGDWMLFILAPDDRRLGCDTCVTVVNGPSDNDWTNALARGYIHTPPPRQLPVVPSQRVGIRQSLAAARAARRDGSLLTQTLAVHPARRRQARAERQRVVAELTRLQRDHQQARSHARHRHRRRHRASR